MSYDLYGLYKSFDNGKTFVQDPTVDHTAAVFDIKVASDGVVYVGTVFGLYVMTRGPTCSRAKQGSPPAEMLQHVPCRSNAWTLQGSLGTSAPETEEQKRFGC